MGDLPPCLFGSETFFEAPGVNVENEFVPMRVELFLSCVVRLYRCADPAGGV